MSKLHALVVLAVLALATAAVAWAAGNFNSPMSGDQEVPERETLARGNAIYKLSDDGMSLDYKLIVANIENVTQAHIHLGPSGANGPVVVWLYPDTSPPADPGGGGRLDGVIAEGTITAANLVGPLAGMPFAALIDAMKAGNTYTNVHTDDGVAPPNTGAGDFPGGEVRGQIRQNGR